MFSYGGDGIAGDTFCHLVDAWVEGNIGRLSARAIDKKVDGLDRFTAARGDRFADSTALANAIELWELAGKRTDVDAARPILDDLLAMWRSADEVVAEGT